MRLTFRRLVPLVLVAVMVLMEPAAAKKKQADGTVSEIRDDRIQESSALAVSVKHDDLVYTVNDRGNRATIFAIQLSTGNVVGTTDVSSLEVEDTESLAVDALGTLWLGDLGDNDHERDNVAIISLPEPGPGDNPLPNAVRYPVSLPDGPVDIEGMLVNPETNEVHLVTKSRDGLGTIYELPRLTPDVPAEATDLDVEVPQEVTDATFTHDGRWALLRTNDDVWIYDPKTWKPADRIGGPDLPQAESIAVERGDRTVLLGSEGKNSPIVRMELPDDPGGDGPIRLDDSSGSQLEIVPALAVLAAGLVVAAVLVVRRNRLRRNWS